MHDYLRNFSDKEHALVRTCNVTWSEIKDSEIIRINNKEYLSPNLSLRLHVGTGYRIPISVFALDKNCGFTPVLADETLLTNLYNHNQYKRSFMPLTSTPLNEVTCTLLTTIATDIGAKYNLKPFEKLNQVGIENIQNLLLTGNTADDICAALQIMPSSLYKWIRSSDENMMGIMATLDMQLLELHMKENKLVNKTFDATLKHLQSKPSDEITPKDITMVQKTTEIMQKSKESLAKLTKSKQENDVTIPQVQIIIDSTK